MLMWMLWVYTYNERTVKGHTYWHLQSWDPTGRSPASNVRSKAHHIWSHQSVSWIIDELKINYNTERTSKTKTLFRKIRKHRAVHWLHSLPCVCSPAFSVTPFRLIWIIILDGQIWLGGRGGQGQICAHTHTNLDNRSHVTHRDMITPFPFNSQNYKMITWSTSSTK